MPISSTLSRTYGRGAMDRRCEARAPTAEGARAALESFYFAFNRRSIEALNDVWAPDPLITLNNPLGGIMRGIEEIRALYQRVFTGPVQVWVEFYAITEYVGQDTAIFAGRERGEFTRDGHVPLAIRTSRVFQYQDESHGWRQVHERQPGTPALPHPIQPAHVARGPAKSGTSRGGDRLAHRRGGDGLLHASHRRPRARDQRVRGDRERAAHAKDVVSQTYV